MNRHKLLLAGVFLIMAGCAADNEGAGMDTVGMDSVAVDTTAEVGAPGTQTGTGGMADASPSDDVITPDGWGPLRIGMTRDEVIAAAGPDANPNAVGGAEPESCEQFRPENAPNGLLVMLENSRLTRISVGEGTDVHSDRGIAVGATADEVRAAYPTGLISQPHKYVAPPAGYLIAWRDSTAADRRGLLYETDESGHVVAIRAGGEAIQYVEGCG